MAKRVVVAMSGGVDSSVAAALCVEQGYDVIGVMMRLWSEDDGKSGGHNRCCTPDQMSDARTVADKLGIPFYVLDTRSVFRNSVVRTFLDRYSDGLTPNPCLECNRHIRFEWLLNNALALDADYLATGHYARINQTSAGDFQLLKGLDEAKDQSYVLSVIGQAQLAHTLFPVGSYHKPEVRALAEKFDLPVASKHDSQDLCFLADGDYRRFLAEHTPHASQPGPILLRDGRQIGEHTGLPNYTIGQRKGINLSWPEPLYVLATDTRRNTLIVGPAAALGRDRLTANTLNWINGTPPAMSFRAEVKIRYKARPAWATVTVLAEDQIEIQFDSPVRDITPGQGAICYDGDVCLGGGIIERLPAPQFVVSDQVVELV